MYCPTPFRSNWTPGTSTTRTCRSPSWSLPDKRHPAVQGAVSQLGIPTAATPRRWPISHGVATGSHGGSASVSSSAARPPVRAACSLSDCLALPHLAHINAQCIAMPTLLYDLASPATDLRLSTVPLALPQPSTRAVALAAARWAQRVAIYQQVWTFQRQGWRLEAIAQQVGLSRRTVQRYLQSPTFPECQPRHGRDRSSLGPYKATLLAEWNRGCRNGSHVFRMIRNQGFRGQYGIMASYIRRLRQAQGLAPWQRHSDRPLPAVAGVPRYWLTPRRATWLVLRPPARSTAQDHHQLAQLTTQAPELAEAVTLAQDFATLVRGRQPSSLEPWLARATASALPPFRRFARGLQADYAAAQAAVMLPWGQGPIEGRINRLKRLKRPMFGRVRIDLLARRFLLAA